MKKIIYFLLALVILTTNSLATNTGGNGYNAPIVKSNLNFTAKLENGSVIMNWSKYVPTGFNYYKVIRSTTKANPVYPDDGYIFFTSNGDETSYIDKNKPTEKTYYRVCAIASPNRYCSKVITFNPDKIKPIEDYVDGEITSEDVSNQIETSGNVALDYLNNIFSDQKDWKKRCSAWGGTISGNNCTWHKGVMWCDAPGLYDGACLSVFRQYGDPRPKAKGLVSKPPVKENLATHPYKGAIDYLKEKGVVKGYEDGSFKPDNKINRAEFLKIVVTGAGKTVPTQAGNCFGDVKNEWFSTFVCYAKNTGIINGYDDNTFKPTNEITFAEAVKIVAEAFGIEKDESYNKEWYSSFIKPFTDNNYAPETIKNPDHKITRGEMAELIWRVKEKVKNKKGFVYKETPVVKPIIKACTKEYMPVCGEVGGKKETFANTCLAANANAKNVVVGSCEVAKEDEKPAICTMDYNPVCGKLGDKFMTFANTCGAKVVGATDIKPGECVVNLKIKNEGEICGGIAGFICSDGLICSMSGATYPDASGICKKPLVGGDRDIHGCIPSAGYSWCSEKNKCLRIWEEKCELPQVSTGSTSSNVLSGSIATGSVSQ